MNENKGSKSFPAVLSFDLSEGGRKNNGKAMPVDKRRIFETARASLLVNNVRFRTIHILTDKCVCSVCGAKWGLSPNSLIMCKGIEAHGTQIEKSRATMAYTKPDENGMMKIACVFCSPKDLEHFSKLFGEVVAGGRLFTAAHRQKWVEVKMQPGARILDIARDTIIQLAAIQGIKWMANINPDNLK